VHASYGLPPTPMVLDVGCGPGRLLAPLHQLGWRVTGLEPDEDYATAAQRVAASLPGVTVRVAGFERLSDQSTYDLIAAVNGPYSYVRPMAARREAIARCAVALRPGGVLFLDLSNFWWILKNYRDPPRMTMNVDDRVVERTATHVFDYHEGTLTHEDTFAWRDGAGVERTTTKVHRMALIGLAEVALFLGECGFADIRTFNGYGDRAPGKLTGKKLMVTARVPA